MINQRFLNTFQYDQQLFVDKSMIPCFGKHSAKQYIKGKPIKFGYNSGALILTMAISFSLIFHVQVKIIILRNLV